MKVKVEIIIACLLTILATGFGYAKDIHVPDDFDTIREAIDAAFPGDRVLVAAGLYKENIGLKSSVDVLGSGSNVTTITSQSGDKIVRAEGVTNMTLGGFTIEGYPPNSHTIIYCKNSSFTINNNTINGPEGEGIHCLYSFPTIDNNIITGSKYGVLCYDYSSPVITNNFITDNGYGVYCDNESNPTISNNTITKNDYGIHCDESPPEIISNNTITDNHYGISCYHLSPPISNNTIISNDIGISCQNDASPTIIGNNITDNKDYGIECDYTSAPNISNNTITNNGNYGIYCHENSSPTISVNVITNNGIDGILCTNWSTPSVSGNIIMGNINDGISCWKSANPDLGGGARGSEGFNSIYGNGYYHVRNGTPNTIRAENNWWGEDPPNPILFSGFVDYDPWLIKPPGADFTWQPDNPSEGDEVQFIDQSIPQEGIVSWEWDFGDGVTSTEQNPKHTFEQAANPSQTFDVNLTVEWSNGNSDTATKAVIIDDRNPVCNFTWTPEENFEGDEVQFTDKSTSHDGITSWEWDFGDDETSQEQNPKHIYEKEGTYTVQLTVKETDGDSDTVTKDIVISDKDPIADFVWSPENPVVGQEVQFEDRSISYDGIILQSWDFGDGGTSIKKNPKHIYTNTGIYTVSLTVREVDGDEATEEKQLSVKLASGDISGNGNVTAYDASLAIQFIVGLITLSPKQQQAADVTGDETVSALDAAWILQYTVGLIVEFPVQSVPATPALNSEFETKLLTEAIKQLDTTHITREQKQVLEQFKSLISKQLLPKRTALLQNYPNPFNPETWIPYQLATDSSVTISVYNAKGQIIRAISLGTKQAGVYVKKDKAAYWDGKDSLCQSVASGVYYYTLQAGEFRATQKMVIIK